MKIILILFMIITISFKFGYFLKCDVRNNNENDENFKQIYQKCLRHNNSSSEKNNKMGNRNFNDNQKNNNDYSNEYESDEMIYHNYNNNNGKQMLRVKRQQNSNEWNQRRDENGNNNETLRKLKTDCFVHCFFKEMKMINNKELPDKNKIINFLVKNLQDRYELRDFMIDSIRECFHILEYNHISDKCEFSKNLGVCLTERAQANCDHWDGKDVLF